MINRWPLTGRGEELHIIRDMLVGSEHKGVVIAGLAGVGKTRLARAAADAAAVDGWSVRRVAGTASGQQVTLGAFARWAEAPDDSPLTLTHRIFTGLTTGAGDTPRLLVVDDAHLLDDVSALIVHQLVIHDVACVIATIRTGEAAPDAVRALWKDGLLRRLELQPLSRNESDRLLTTVLDGPVDSGCADQMWTLSRGNVLFLHHLVEYERESGRLVYTDGAWRLRGTPSASASLVELVELQIGTVPDDVRNVVDLVAIAEPIERGVLSALADQTSIETAEMRGLIAATPARDAVYVGHPLYGEIRLKQCGPLRLAHLRGLIAKTMVDTDVTDPLRLGLLWLASDLPADATILSRAAHVAGCRLDLELAERLARAGLDADASPATKIALAYILVMRSKGEPAEEILNTLSASELAVPGMVDGATLHAANQLFLLGNLEGARAVINEALALGDHDRSHGLLAYRAVVEVMAAEPHGVIETMATVDYARMDDFARAIGYAAETIALGDLGRVAEAGARARAGYRVLDESPLEAFQGTGLAEFDAYMLMAAGHVAEATAVAQREFRRPGLSGISLSLAVAALGMTALGRGDLVSALDHLRSAKASFGSSEVLFAPFYRFDILLTEALARSGDVDAAIASMERTHQGRHAGYRYVESGYLLSQAWVAAVSGQTTKAREFVSQSAEFARSHGQLAREVLSLQTATQFGDTSNVHRLAELATLVEGPRASLAARYARALSDDDAAGLDAVSRGFEAIGDVLTAADAAAHAADCYRRTGHRGSALTASGRARSLAKRCGNATSPALASARVPLPFTRREREVATLLANGLSNRDIAQAMSLSVRTVEGHIYQANAKAGVSSRVELAELIQAFGDPDVR